MSTGYTPSTQLQGRTIIQMSNKCLRYQEWFGRLELGSLSLISMWIVTSVRGFNGFARTVCKFLPLIGRTMWRNPSGSQRRIHVRCRLSSKRHRYPRHALGYLYRASDECLHSVWLAAAIPQTRFDWSNLEAWFSCFGAVPIILKPTSTDILTPSHFSSFPCSNFYPLNRFVLLFLLELRRYQWFIGLGIVGVVSLSVVQMGGKYYPA